MRLWHERHWVALRLAWLVLWLAVGAVIVFAHGTTTWQAAAAGLAVGVYCMWTWTEFRRRQRERLNCPQM
jgi:membrane associated rhomboid family serine protease